MVRKLFSLATLTLLLASCTNAIDNVENLLQRAGADSELPVFYATIEGSDDAATKVFADDQMRVLWNADDRITVFNKYSYGYEYSFTGQDGDNAGEFAAVPNNNIVTGNALDHVYALYPHSSSTKISNDGAITATLPSQQTHKPNSFGIGANTMLSVTDDTQLRFKNVGGYLSFKFYGEGVSVKHITLRGNNHEKLAGKVSITMPVGGTPTVEMQEDATESITLTCETPVGLGADVEHYTEFWFVLPPTTFTQGFTVRVTDPDGKVFEKSTTSEVEIGRNHLSRMSPMEVVLVEDIQLALEREALIAIYNALDGDNWSNNTNWCSDKPVNEWYGIYTTEQGNVCSISLMYNNLNGTLPKEISYLKELTSVQLDGLSGSVPEEIGELLRLTSLQLSFTSLTDTCIPKSIENLTLLQWLNLTYWDYATTHAQDDPSVIPETPIPIPTSVYSCDNLTSFSLSGNFAMESFVGINKLNRLEYFNYVNQCATISIPAEIGSLTNLKTLRIICQDMGTIPSSVSNLQSLESLVLWGFSSFDTSCICNISTLRELSLEGAGVSIPSEIGNLTELRTLYGPFMGPIPAELGLLNKLEVFQASFPNGPENGLFGGALSGIVPDSIKHLDAWVYGWDKIVFFHPNIMWDYPISKAPNINAIDIKGNDVLTSYANNPLTLLFAMYNAYDSYNQHINEKLLDLYSKYHNEGLEIVSWFNPSAGEELTGLLDEQQVNVPWHHYSTIKYPFRWGDYRSTDNYPTSLVDSNGDIVYFFGDSIDVFASFDENFEKLETFIKNYLGHIKESDRYSSTDYSSDGVVTIIQQSSIQNGPSIIFLGDGFSDRLISNGSFSSSVGHAIDALFSEEPFHSYRNLFNIYSISVVSENELYDEFSNTALGGWFSEGTQCGGNNVRAMEYALKGIPYEAMDDAVIIVLMNKDAYAGTCYMYYPPSGDYGSGLSIVYIPTNSDTDIFNGLVSHEAGGHGFAKLADEYAYEYMGAIPADEMANRKALEPYGWWKNVDFTSDPTQVKWSHFIADARYTGQGLGCFEGGLTYWTGVWRPTENSIMRYNTGGFNAPSREAIWYRIHKLAYGANWQYNYEDFVTYDAVNRTAAVVNQAPRPDYVTRQLPKPTPPVVVGHSWREAVKEK